MSEATKEVRAALLAFVKAVQDADYGVGLHRLVRLIDKPGGSGWETVELVLSFGDGYFDKKNIYIYVGDDGHGEAETETAIDAYLQGKVPPIIAQVKEEPTPLNCTICGHRFHPPYHCFHAGCNCPDLEQTRQPPTVHP